MIKTIAQYLSTVLQPIELGDESLYEVVDLDKYIPSLPVASFQSRQNSRKSTRKMIDPAALTKESIAATRLKRQQAMEQSKPSEKDQLLQKQAILEQQIVEKSKKIAELEKTKARLQNELANLQSRSSIKSRISVTSQEVNEAEEADAQYWKSRYEEMERAYEEYMAALNKKGVCVRKSSNQLKQIPAPSQAK